MKTCDPNLLYKTDRISTVVVSQTPSPTHQPYWGLDPTLPDSIGGHPAYRYIHQIIQAPNAFEYAKTAWTYHNDELYMFSYLHIVDLARCDAPPLSEDAVYEHFLTTVEFLD